jgi:hypothetical protein
MALHAHRALILLICAFASAAVYAERCGEVDVCIGKVMYVHVPERQLRVPLLFPEAGLPKIGAVVNLRDRVSLIDEGTFSDKVWLPRLIKELVTVTSGSRTLEWNMLLRKGAEVEILSYNRFPQLEEMAGQQFVKVLVRTE